MMPIRPPFRTARTRRAPQANLLDLCPPFLTRVQAAQVAGRTTRTIDRWLADPEVPLTPRRGRGKTRAVLIDREELRALITPVPEEPKVEGRPEE